MSGEDLKLGEIIHVEQERDCIHIAVIPMEAGELLKPGDKVGFIDHKSNKIVGKTDATIGVVDPYLTTNVKKGQKFWLFLLPGSISNLRHHWDHAVFAARTAFGAGEAEKYIKWQADELGLDYDALMNMAKAYADYGSEVDDQGEMLLEDSDTFWRHFETLTGKKASGDFFTCC